MDYVELHCKSNFSFLEGASHADELVDQAVALGYSGLAITDRNSLAGVVRGYTAAKDANLPFIVGTELHPVDSPPIVVWPTDRKSYGKLCRLLTVGRERCEKGTCLLYWNDIASYSEGLIGGVFLSGTTQERHQPVPTKQSVTETHTNSNTPSTFHTAIDSNSTGLQPLHRFREVFGDAGYLLMHLHLGVDDRAKMDMHVQWSKQTGLPLLAAGNVHYHKPERMLLHDLLLSIANGTTVDQIAANRFNNAQYSLRSKETLAQLYRDIPDALAKTLEVAQRCRFTLDQLRYEYPTESSPNGMTAMEHLKRLVWAGAKKRYGDRVPSKIIEMLRHEISIIEDLRYEAYFLTVWDLVRFARSRAILCQGRGSAANSVVCYCLGVTSVDPNEMDLLFERFISRERNEAPDIDVDFEHQRREEVIQYIYEKYGRERAGMTAAVTTYRTRSAVRDCGKALGISLDRIDALTKIVDGRGYSDATKSESKADSKNAKSTPSAQTPVPTFTLEDHCRYVGIDTESLTGKRFLYLVQHLVGFPRHLSQHTGGMVMTSGPLCELCPIENAAMEGRTVIQWDKDDLDTLGILKVDCLALGMLSAIHRSFDLIDNHYQRQLSLANIPQADSGVYDMICRADTLGVFQIESRAQMSMLPRLKPRCFYDLVIEVAIVRPGPIQGQMVHPYLKARQTGEQPPYPAPEIGQVLAKTLGVPIFQEQAMRLAVVAAGFTPGEADQLRRAMAAWRRPGIIDQFRRKLIDGMLAKGLDEKFAENVFMQLRGFGEYGFPESHAASFALLVYVSCWLKHHYPDVFCAAMLNSQPLGFYTPAQLVQDARDHGVEVLGSDINQSSWDSSLVPIKQSDHDQPRADLSTSGQNEPNKPDSLDKSNQSFRGCSSPLVKYRLRLGMRMVTGLQQSIAESIIEERTRNGPYKDSSDLVRRTRISQATTSSLAESGMLESITGDRRAAYWQSLAVDKKAKSMPLLEANAADDDELVPDELKAMTKIEEVYADYSSTGLSLRGHPIEFCRPELKKLHVTPANRLSSVKHGQYIRVAGLIVLRQRPGTAKGITFATLEDETGSVNLVIKQAIWQKYYIICKQSNAWLAHGVLESRENVIHVLVGRIEDLTNRITGFRPESRDFR